MPNVRKVFRRLFFYSSRQLSRRRKSYLSIFLTSVVLLSLVMTFLEMAESWFLRDIEISDIGYHHARIREMMNDYTSDISSDPRIEDAWSIPYTSYLASSDDTSLPGRLVVPSEAIYDRLNVRYIWGHEPGNGEIAVSRDLYNAYSYLTAGAENELYFKASSLTYFPLTVSGIYECNDRDAGYVFVTQDTADAIDAETRSPLRYDLYLRCKYDSDRYVPTVLDSIFRDLRIPDTRWQSVKELSGRAAQSNKYQQLEYRYRDYINSEYLHFLQTQNTLPVIAISMPVIVLVALMMASFMSGWVTSHSEEYGVLGAIGANRRQICAISAGQILLIGMIAAVPVVILSAAVSNIYISAFNAASSSDVDFVFAVPWIRLVEAALWWCVLACFFSYIGIARITREMPYVLLSGQAKNKIPYVARSSARLSKAKDKIFAFSILKSVRHFVSRILTALITSLVCIVCGAFVLLLVIHRGQTAQILDGYEKYLSDMTVSVPVESNAYGRKSPVTEDLLAELLEYPCIAKAGLYDVRDANDTEVGQTEWLSNGEMATIRYPFRRMEDDRYVRECVYTMDRTVLEAAVTVIEGDPYRIFEDPTAIIAVVSPYYNPMPQVGDKIFLSGSRTTAGKNGEMYHTYSDPVAYTVCAVILPGENHSDISLRTGSWILSDSGRQLCGLPSGQWDRILAWFHNDFPTAELGPLYEKMRNSPSFLRYNITAVQVQTASEERIQTASTAMLCFFFAMLYLSFCTMTGTDSLLKVTKERREIAILRQIGGDDRAIHKTVQTEALFSALVALGITLLLALVIPTVYILTEAAYIRALGDFLGASPASIDLQVDKIIQRGLFLYALFLPAFPAHFLSAGVTVLSTYLPTRRILQDPIAEGIRKDTE